MKIYNTMTNKLEKFIPIEENKVKMYVCGPTVYNYIHLGNARPIIVFDTLARFFKCKGYKVEYVQNFTDVDDKIIKRAIEEKIKPEEVATKYIEGFFEDINQLNVLKDIVRPKVTEHMTEIIEMIEKLIENGYAYENEGNVFFDVRKYEDYGNLSNQKIEELEAGARVNVLDIKKDSLDFTLWKPKKEGEPYWDSPWGQGRPGWHIECSAMSKKYLGETFDIHGGGQDLIFPHHENEIAQSKCSGHGDFAKYWMHNGFINVDGDKMSKSLGNFFLLREILDKFDGNIVRLFVLSTHYRKPINFSLENIEDSRKALQSIISSVKRYEEILCKNNINFENSMDKKNKEIVIKSENVRNFMDKIKVFDKKFDEAMSEDMNTPQAIATIFDQIRETNKYYDVIFENVTEELLEGLFSSYMSLKNKMENILGIELINKVNEENDEMSKELIELLIKIRTDARAEKNFKLSDEIRDSLKVIGVEIKDNKDGTTSYEII